MIEVTKKQYWEAEYLFRGKNTGVAEHGCYPPRKGQWLLKPTGKKGVFQLVQAEQDYKKHNYTIVSPHAADRLLKLYKEN